MALFNVGALLNRRKPAASKDLECQEPQKKILFVCTGNIARSASAQYIAEQLLPAESNWIFDSAGTGAVVGSGVAPFIDKELAERGIAFQGHRAKPVTEALLAESALVLVMEKEHLDWIVREWPQYHSRVHLLKQMARVKAIAGRRADPIAFMRQSNEPPEPRDRISDPYRKGPEAARRAVAEIEEALREIVPWLGL